MLKSDKSELGIDVYKNVKLVYTDNYIDDFFYNLYNKRDICRMLQGKLYGRLINEVKFKTNNVYK